MNKKERSINDCIRYFHNQRRLLEDNIPDVEYDGNIVILSVYCGDCHELRIRMTMSEDRLRTGEPGSTIHASVTLHSTL